jgi:hypothetical protein
LTVVSINAYRICNCRYYNRLSNIKIIVSVVSRARILKAVYAVTVHLIFSKSDSSTRIYMCQESTGCSLYCDTELGESGGMVGCYAATVPRAPRLSVP